MRVEAKRIHDIADRYFLGFYKDMFVKGVVSGKQQKPYLNEMQNEASKHVARDKVEMDEKRWLDYLYWMQS